MINVAVENNFDSFRRKARELIANRVPPQDVIWSQADAAQSSLFALAATPLPLNSHRAPTLDVPKRYFELARLVSHHRDPARWQLLYSVLWRISHGERNLLSLHIDNDVLRLSEMRKEIARDVHHMHAFVRFRRIERDGQEWFVAWYKPDHPVLRLAARFFAERFAAMRWAILTPDESVYWNGSGLRFAEGVDMSGASSTDALETLWSTYYRTTFNPARMNVDLMRQEMPSRFWSNLPELQSLSNILAEAPERIATMKRQQADSALSFVPQTRDLSVLQQAASACTACPLHCNATQTVFGEGSQQASIVLVGEQPGDVEDQIGRPFVGPAGEVLHRAMAQAGIDRAAVYVTNAVKHFKHRREGKRRIHQTPRMSEIIACKPWLEAELEALRPKAVVLLGATAARSLLGASVRITQNAGKVVSTRYAEHTVISVHPSFVLRSADEKQARAIFDRLVADLMNVRELVFTQTL